MPVRASCELNHLHIKGWRSHSARRLPTQKQMTCTSQLSSSSAAGIAISAPTPKQAKMKPGVTTSKAKRMKAATSQSCQMGI